MKKFDDVKVTATNEFNNKQTQVFSTIDQTAVQQKA